MKLSINVKNNFRKLKKNSDKLKILIKELYNSIKNREERLTQLAVLKREAEIAKIKEENNKLVQQLVEQLNPSIPDSRYDTPNTIPRVATASNHINRELLDYLLGHIPDRPTNNPDQHFDNRSVRSSQNMFNNMFDEVAEDERAMISRVGRGVNNNIRLVIAPKKSRKKPSKKDTKKPSKKDSKKPSKKDSNKKNNNSKKPSKKRK